MPQKRIPLPSPGLPCQAWRRALYALCNRARAAQPRDVGVMRALAVRAVRGGHGVH